MCESPVSPGQPGCREQAGWEQEVPHLPSLEPSALEGMERQNELWQGHTAGEPHKLSHPQCLHQGSSILDLNSLGIWLLEDMRGDNYRGKREERVKPWQSLSPLKI